MFNETTEGALPATVRTKMTTKFTKPSFKHTLLNVAAFATVGVVIVGSAVAAVVAIDVFDERSSNKED